MATNYTTKTAALKATTGTIRQLDTRQVAVNKKIEIGAVAKDENGLPVSGTSVDSTFVSTDKVYVTDTREGSETQGKRTDVMDILSTMKNGIDVGTKTTEADNDTGDAIKPYGGISKINFKGEFVTVVSKGEDELDLWIQKSTMYPEINQALVGAPTSTGSAKLFSCTDTNQTHTIPVNSGTTYSQITLNKLNSSGWGTNTMYLKAKTGHTTFSVDKTLALFVRTDYNGGTGTVIKVPFNVAAGTFSIAKKYEDGVTAATTSPFSGSKGSKTDSKGTKVEYFCAPFGDAEAEFGRIPGQAEVEITITQTLSDILTLGGGSVVFNWAIDKATLDAPSVAWTSVNMFYTQHKKPTVTLDSVVYKSKTDSDAVSGLIYNTAGSKATVTVSALNNSQWKSSNTSDKRLTVSAAGKTDVNAFNASSLTKTLTKTGDDSSAVYSGSVDVTLGSTGNGSAEIKVRPHGYIDGDYTAAKTLGQFWGSIPSNASKTYEPFGKETYRMKKHDTPTDSDLKVGQTTATAANAYPSATSVLDASLATGIPVSGYEDCVQAVCQYGQLMHPNYAAADAKGTSYGTSTTKPAIFIRKFQYTSDQKLSFSGTNLGLATAVYWFDGASWNQILQNSADGTTYKKTNNSITVQWNKDLHAQINSTNIPLIAIVFASNNSTKISPVTLA